MNRSTYYRAGLRAGFDKSVFKAGAVTVMRPNADGVLAPVPADKIEHFEPKPLPTHAEMNAVRFERD